MTEVTGWALGPGTTEEAFDFVTADIDRLKVGEFVYYTPESRDSKILARIRERERIVSDKEIIEAVKGEIPKKERKKFQGDRGYRVTAKVLGVYDESYEGFRNLREPPRLGQEVYYATNDHLSEIVMPPKRRGILHLGSVLNREGSGVDVFVDMDEIATKHLGVLASTGAGKSYTVGVVLEEMVKPGNRGASFVFDIHGEYYTLSEDEEYGDHFNLVEEPKIKVSNLEVEDFDVAFSKEMDDVQRQRLREVLEDLDLDASASGSSSYRESVRVDYSIDNIIDRLGEGNPVDDNLSWRLDTLNDFMSLTKDTETDVEGLCEAGKCNVIEFPTGASELERNLILWYFTNKILSSRKTAVRMKRGRRSTISRKDVEGGLIEVPVTIFIEEAHNFAPVDRELKTRGLLQEISREGRKFGVGLCIISQRPSRLDEDVLSQCNSSIIMKVRNAVDQETIAHSVEAAGEDLLRDLPGLTTGQAILAGDFVNTPVLTKIRERETEHGGRTPEVAEESVKGYSENSDS
ncbi:MAG: ATP-binding protein [Halobacteria archaeon]